MATIQLFITNRLSLVSTPLPIRWTLGLNGLLKFLKAVLFNTSKVVAKVYQMCDFLSKYVFKPSVQRIGRGVETRLKR